MVEYFRSIVPDCQVETYPLEGPKGHTDMVRILIPGRNGKSKGGSAKTMGILGRLGGLGARPEQLGFVSDGDGALTALAVAAKLCRPHAGHGGSEDRGHGGGYGLQLRDQKDFPGAEGRLRRVCRQCETFGQAEDRKT